MRYAHVDHWLSWLESLHPKAIDPGLERIGVVAGRLGLTEPGVPVITVAGTNGKGSTVAALTAISRASGHRPGAYTSPHVLRYEERIAINGESVDDERLLAAFDAIDRARGELTLSYFEFGTLAALWCFRDAGCDLWLLEVGLGGRLDATNVLAPTVAVITNVDLDHTEWLGDNREAIGREKAGILRPATPLICADPSPPASVLAHAASMDCPIYRLGDAFRIDCHGGRWSYVDAFGRFDDLPAPGGVPEGLLVNPAGAIAALRRLRGGLPPDKRDLARALVAAVPPARCQRLQRTAPWIVDVAHNQGSALMLAERLNAEPCVGRTHGVFALMERKDAAAVVAALRRQIDVWHLLALDDPNLHSPDELAALLSDADSTLGARGNAVSLMRQLDGELGPSDRVVAFGSFRVAEDVLRAAGCYCDGLLTRSLV